MGYDVKYDDITNFYLTLNQLTAQINEGLANVANELSNMVQLESFKGNTADNMKSYIQEVSFTLIASAVAVLNELGTQCLLYKDGYGNIDEDLHFRIMEDKLSDLNSTFYKESLGEFFGEHNNATNAMNSVNDIVALPALNYSHVEESYSHTMKSLDELRTAVSEYESTHKTNDFTLFNEMLNALNSLIGEVASQENGPVTYRSKDILNSPSMQKLGTCLESYAESQNEKQEAIVAASEREVQRFEALTEEWAQEREEQGWLKTLTGALEVVGGVFTIVGSVASMVATGGASAPLAIPGIIGGFGMITHGGSDAVEGIQDIYYGSKGDPFTVAVNPIRDTAFAFMFGEENKQKAWDIFGTASAVVGGVGTFGATAWASASTTSARVLATGVCKSAAQQAGRKAVGELVVKGGITMAGGMGGGYIAKQGALAFGASETVSDIAGLLGGVAGGTATGYGMSKWKWSYKPGSAGIQEGVCFVAGTAIMTMVGARAIETIVAGDKVMATNPETKQTVEKEVRETYVRKSDRLVHLWINEEEIQVTANHPFFVADKGWVNAEDLTMEDKLLNPAGELVTIQALRYNTLEEPVTVYNFEVDEFHTYYAGENSVLVHNADYNSSDTGIKGTSGTKDVVDIELKYKEGWTESQRAEANAKVKALSEADTVKTAVDRKGTSASSRYKSAYGSESVPKNYDVDHVIDLQLGGGDDIINMNPLDQSVNRSLGVQIKNAIKPYPEGTVFGKFNIK